MDLQTISSSLAASVGESGLSGGLIFLTILLISIVALCVLMVVSSWKIYVKTGRKGWESLIPFYNTVILLHVLKKPLWWILILLFVPVLNIIFGIILARRLAAVFGKGVGFTWGLVLLPFIFYPILAFGKSVYENTFPEPGPISEPVKWTLIAFALFMVVEGMLMLAGAISDREDASLHHQGETEITVDQ